MSKSEALLQKAEKRQPQSTLPVSNYAISADELLALRCMARERQARPLALAPRPPRPPHHRGRHGPQSLIRPHPHDIFALAPSGDSDSSP